MNYCTDCGSKLKVVKTDREWVCSGCGRHVYKNPIPTVDAALFDENGLVLLGVRDEEPRKGKLNLPGGFVDPNETLEKAIARELQEELGLEPSDYSDLTYVGGYENSYQADNKVRHLLSVVFVGSIKHRDFSPNSEVSKYLWISPDKLESDQMTTKLEYDQILLAAKALGYKTR